MKRLILLCALVLFGNMLFAQTGTVKGTIREATNNQPVPFANVVISGTTIGAATDFEGNYSISQVPLGYQKLEVTAVGFEPAVSRDFLVTKSNVQVVDITLSKAATELEEVVIKTEAFKSTEESPLSLQTLGVEEIERNPGGNRDISKVIQSLPGVASTTSFRNDIIIRGGAPNENRFYLDGVEVPVINHFQTQGSSGGPVGIINVNFIEEVSFYSGAFPANRGNALSSVLEFRQVDGNSEQWKFRGTVGSSDIGFTADGPLGDKTTFIGSVRRSYLQFLFSALKLPFLPTFTDAQFKVKHKLNDKNQLTFIGLGAFDEFNLNTSVNEGITDVDELARNRYILGNIPVNEQWNYTVGAVYKHFADKSFQTLVVSRNALNNSAYKYEGNDESDPNNLIQDYLSTETENKLRFEHTYRNSGFKLNLGLNAEHLRYTNETFNKVASASGPIIIDFSSDLDLFRYGFFGQASQDFFERRLTLSAGLRLDGNDYNSNMSNPINQLSPRLSASFAVNDRWRLNANVGRYTQLPPATILGYADGNGNLVNDDNNLKYIKADHYVAGVQYNPDASTKITVEGFYKNYTDYPFLLRDSISLANLGADFGVIGNEPANSTSSGRSYGAEFLIQRRSAKGIYGILAYTFVRSEFINDGDYVPSAWDSRHIISLTGGKKLKRNWEIGGRWRFVAGQPFTPYDVQATMLRSNWDVRGRGLFNYRELNSERIDAFHQLDVRVDKVWFFEKWSLNLYLDVQNVYNFQAVEQDILSVQRDAGGNPLVDPNNPNAYLPDFIENTAGNVLPTIGIIVDF